MSTFSTCHLGDYIARERFASLPSDVIDKAKLCLLDSLGCLYGGYSSPLGPVMERYRGELASPGSGCCNLGRSRDPATKAADFAVMINALDYDDIYWKGHPGATVMAAAFGLAGHVECSGKELIEAITVGYEVGCRVGMSLIHAAPRKAVHGHGTWQVFGAAATAAKLLRLTPEEAAQALAIAAATAPVASVMKTVYGAASSMAKNNFGAATHAGVTAAFLARSGFTGPLDVFEGDAGFWRMAGADAGDLDRLTMDLGHHYEIRDVGFKAYSCCRILQSSIEAVVTAAGKSAIASNSAAIRSIDVLAPPIVCKPPFSDPNPGTMWAAEFSAPFVITMALLGVEPGPSWYTEDRFGDPTVMDLAAKIDLQPYLAEHGSSHHAARASVHFEDGGAFEASVEVASGEASNPLPAAFLLEKFHRLAAIHTGPEKASALSQYVINIEKKQTVDLRDAIIV